MKKLIVVLLLFMVGCSVDRQAEISKEVSALNTPEAQTNFLNEIQKLDQEVRSKEGKALQEFGYNSVEHQLAVKQMIETDDENLLKIEAYLNAYGHPTKKVHGADACYTPYLVIHHASGDDAPRRRNFKYLYRAYTNGDLDASPYSLYLNRLYFINFRKKINWNRPYRVEEELDTLYRALDLEAVIQELDQI